MWACPSTRRSTIGRLLLAGLPLGAAAVLTRCHLDQLLSPSALGKLRVSPTTLADSVTVGDTAPSHLTLSVESSASVAWQASVASGSTWIELGQTADTVPSSLDGTLQPAGLAEGVYRDAIILRSASPDGSVTRVPVTLVVQPQPPPPPPPPPPTPRRLAFVTDPTTVQAGGTIAPPVQVAARDSVDHLVPGFTGAITLAIGANPSGGALAGTRTVDAVNGVATFSDLSIDKEGAGYTLTASSGSLAGATSAAFNVLGIGNTTRATHLWFVVQPTNVDRGAVITPAVQVAAHDANGQAVTEFTGPISVSMSKNPSCATLLGTRTVGAVNGIATFGDLSIDRVGQTVTIVAQATGLTEIESSPFNVTGAGGVSCGTPTHLWVTVQPRDTRAGAAIAPAIQVAAHDNAGNVALGFNGDMTVRLGRNPAGGTLSGTLTVTAVNGVATFSDVHIDRPGSSYTVVFSAAGLLEAETSAFNILP